MLSSHLENASWAEIETIPILAIALILVLALIQCKWVLNLTKEMKKEKEQVLIESREQELQHLKALDAVKQEVNRRLLLRVIMMEIHHTSGLVHPYLSKPLEEVVVEVKDMLMEMKFPTLTEQVVLADLVVVLVVTLTMLVVVLQTLLHLQVNLVMLEAIQQQKVAHHLVEEVVLVVPDKIIDQVIMQDMVVLE